MGYPRKNAPLSVYGMGKMIDDEKRKRGIPAEVLENAITEIRALNLSEHVNLRDEKELRRRAEIYVSVCKANSAVPTMIGYCRSIGVTYRGVRQHITRNPDDSGSRFLSVLSEMFTEIRVLSAGSHSSNILSLLLSKIDEER